MKILISGNKGFIGTHLQEYLKEMLVNAEIFGVDIADGQNVLSHEPIENIDYVFHLAAQTDVQQSVENPFFDAMNNILCTIKLALDYPNARFIYAGSAASKKIQSPYGLSKKTGADYVKLLHKNYVICNFPNVYGQGGRGVVDIFKSSDIINITGSGKQTRTFVDVLDIINGLRKAMNWKQGEYDLGSGKETSILNLAKATGKQIIFTKALKGEVKKSLIKNTTPDWSPVFEPISYLKNGNN